eukprot:7104401-Pyramimonas_sp.AAC.1
MFVRLYNRIPVVCESHMNFHRVEYNWNPFARAIRSLSSVVLNTHRILLYGFAIGALLWAIYNVIPIVCNTIVRLYDRTPSVDDITSDFYYVEYKQNPGARLYNGIHVGGDERMDSSVDCTTNNSAALP